MHWGKMVFPPFASRTRSAWAAVSRWVAAPVLELELTARVRAAFDGSRRRSVSARDDGVFWFWVLILCWWLGLCSMPNQPTPVEQAPPELQRLL